MSDSLYKDQLNYPVFEKINEQFFAPTKSVIGVNLRGENKIINGRLHLGTWAGPSADLFNLLHEMSHFIEINSRRCHLPSWGLKTGKWVRIAGQYVQEGMFTNQAIERELRTFAIQIHLMNEYNVPKREDHIPHEIYMADLCRYMDAFYLYKSKDESLSYDENEKFAINVIAARILELANDWNMDKIHKAWFKKVKTLRRKGNLDKAA